MRNRFLLPLLTILVGVGALASLGNAQERGQSLSEVDLRGGGAFPLDAHLEATDIHGGKTFQELFDAGGDLFHTPYNSLDGVGGLALPDGTALSRFSAFPPGGGARAQLSSQSCGSCHVRTAFGLAHTHVAGDPDGDGAPPFNVRSTTSLFGDGLVQLLAQEITEQLHAARGELEDAARSAPGELVERALVAKGIDYGVLRARLTAEGDVKLDSSGVRGVDADLVVRPFGWKGNFNTLRSNLVGAAAALMGMQAEELVWRLGEDAGDDPDRDGVARELSVGDITAMVAYNAAQETPQPLWRLADLGMVAPPSEEDAATLERGGRAFESAGCTSCHVPEMRLGNTIFEEPTLRGAGKYVDTFLASRDAGYDPQQPLRFDLLEAGEEPRVEAHPEGGALVRPYSDFRRHQMGRQLADPAGPTPALTPLMAPLELDGELVLIGPGEFLTAELWGVGNSGPWLHDGRATTLEEAVLWHGEEDPPGVGEPGRSEAQESRDAFLALDAGDRQALLSFLRSLRTFTPSRD